jgi:hypothetical protein
VRLVPHLGTNPLTAAGYCCRDSCCCRQAHAMTPTPVTHQPLRLSCKALQTNQHSPAARTAPGPAPPHNTGCMPVGHACNHCKGSFTSPHSKARAFRHALVQQQKPSARSQSPTAQPKATATPSAAALQLCCCSRTRQQQGITGFIKPHSACSCWCVALQG